MFLLNKVFNFRNKSIESDVEKPFLEHLEDLRVMITKIVIVLLISTLGCYVFRNVLMDVLRRPIEVVWQNSQQEKLPKEISPDLWETAKRTANFSATLTPSEREIYFSKFENPKLQHYSRCAGYYRAAMSIEPAERRASFIDALEDASPEIKETTKLLLEKGPTAQLDAKNNVVYMRSLKPTETFMLSIKLAFFAGVIVAFPFVLYFALQFILPGLKQNEKKALWPAMIIGFGLFLTGVSFCYFMVLPKALDFFYTYSGDMGVENEWRIGDYITFATQFTLIFGLSFELPVVVMTMVKIGLLGYETMSNTRSYAIVTIFLIGAIITPTGDALTLFLLAGPMCILYEICIWLAYFSRKKELAQEASEMEAYHAPRLAAAPGTLAAMGDDQQESEADQNDFYHTYYGTGDDEGEEMDDGTISDHHHHDHHYHDEYHEDHKDQAFGHESDAKGLYQPYEIDYNPGASRQDTPPADAPNDGEDDLSKPNNPS